ncbi:hypothetical protein GCM10023093_05410 [Nemorincola caseinilytica]|uniref:HMA domain-containing protein n=1 Tax=Nemorincola caseinilytica TaxID=2054315 RepID=A0ABP8N4G6_9BACT
MKKIIFVCILLWSTPSIAQIRSATLVASGLTCSMCSKAIFKALEAVPSVKAVDVDIERSSYAIAFKDGATISLDEIKAAVENAGFFVASLQVTASFTQTKVANDTHLELGGSVFHFVNVPEQVVNGEKTITVIDKDFLPAKDRKKYTKHTKLTCFETGHAAACCPGGADAQKRIYHVTI